MLNRETCSAVVDDLGSIGHLFIMCSLTWKPCLIPYGILQKSDLWLGGF
jgi:hypothetical protein